MLSSNSVSDVQSLELLRARLSRSHQVSDGKLAQAYERYERLMREARLYVGKRAQRWHRDLVEGAVRVIENLEQTQLDIADRLREVVRTLLKLKPQTA